MHYWNDGNGVGWGGWLAMAVMMVVFWGVIGWVVVSLIRHNSAHSHPSQPQAAQRIEGIRILDDRFARGEIDDDEYTRRRALIQRDA